MGVCVPSLRLPSIHEEGSSGAGAGGVNPGAGAGGSASHSSDRSGLGAGAGAAASGSREYGNSSRFGECIFEYFNNLLFDLDCQDEQICL